MRVGYMVLVSNASLTLSGYVSSVAAATATILPYAEAEFDTAGFSDSAGAGAYRILVVGSEFESGTDGRSADNSPKFTYTYNKNIIMQDYYEGSGTRDTNDGMVELM